MDTEVVTSDTWHCCRNTCCTAHKYSIKMQVESVETEYLLVFIREHTFDL